MKKLFVLWAFLALPSYLAATTYYVDTAGSDAAAGTQAAPWKTLSKVNATSFTAGDVVHLNAGTFGANQNDTTLVIPSSGTAGSPIIFEGAGADLTTITAAAPKSLWGAGTGWEPFGAVAKTWYHLLAKDDSVYSGWKQTTGVNDSILTRVMTATPTTHQGFCVRTAAGATLDTLVVYFNAAADTTNITRSKAYTVTFPTERYNIIMRNMHLTRGTGSAGTGRTVVANTGAGIDTNIVVTLCKITHSYYGITLNKGNTSSITVSYCVFDMLTAYAGTMYGKFGKWYNNTVISPSGLTCQVNSGSIIKNNIFQCTGVSLQVTPAAIAFTSSNNLFYRVSSSYTNFLQRGSTNFSTLASWQDSTGQEANSATGDPLFVSTTLGDYRLTRLSPAYRSGVNVGLTSDMAGKSIIQPPEIGAYEFHPTLFNRVFFGDWK